MFKTSGPVVIFPVVRHRRRRSRARQHAVARRSRADFRDRPFLAASGAQVAERLGLQVEYVPGNWRRGASDSELEARLRADDDPARFKAVVVVHNETSTGVTSRLARSAAGDERAPAIRRC